MLYHWVTLSQTVLPGYPLSDVVAGLPPSSVKWWVYPLPSVKWWVYPPSSVSTGYTLPPRVQRWVSPLLGYPSLGIHPSRPSGTAVTLPVVLPETLREQQ